MAPTATPNRPPARRRCAIAGILLATAVTTVAGLPGAAVVPALGAATYYVDNTNPACSDKGPGTLSQPYCTISAAVKKRGASGVTILVLPGRYAEEVVIDTSGTAGGPFEIRALGGPVVVDGADDFASTALWQHYAGDVYYAPSVTWPPRQVFVDGTRLTPWAADPFALPAEAFFYAPSIGLFVNLGGDDPGTRQTLVGQRSHGFRGFNRHWVILQGFTVTRTENRAIDIDGGSSEWVIRDNVVRHAYRYGIALSNVRRMRVERNVVTDNQDHGISLSQDTRECTIQDNESAWNVHPVYRQATGIRLNGSSDNLLQRNRLHHNQDTGEHLAYGSDHNSSIQNLSWSNGDHGYDRLSARYTLSIGNVAWGNYKDGFSNEGSSPGGQMYNCIAVDNGLTTGEFNLWVDAESSVGFVSDHNIFWNSNGQAPVKFGAAIHPSVASYRAATGQDAHSIEADPRFVDPAAGDFHLQAGSPAIDAATSAPAGWPATDAEGRARVDDPGTPNTGAGPLAHADRGALEFVTDQSPVVTVAAAVTLRAGTPLQLTVTAADPDGDPIASLTADLGGLPARNDAVRLEGGLQGGPASGSDAVFVASADHSAGTLSWTPGAGVAGSFVVPFVATNALSGAASATITVLPPDRAPVVAAPESVLVAAGAPMVVTVTAVDPDGEGITSLTAELGSLPVASDTVRAEIPGDPGSTLGPSAGDDPAFLASPDRTRGTLRWTPGPGVTGSHVVTFTAANAASGSASTRIIVLLSGTPAPGPEPADPPVGGGGPGAGTGPAGAVPAAEAGDGEPLRPRLSPSPARGEATLSFLTSQEGPLTVELYDAAGRRVRRLVDEPQVRPGLQRIAIDGRDDARAPLAPGIYLVRIRTREGVAGARFAILR